MSINEQIKVFLMEKRVSDGGWAPVKPGDIRELSDIIINIARLKWEPDPDGDRPIQCILLDRTKYQPLYFKPLPYPHKDRDGYFEAAISNLARAIADMEMALRLRGE